MFWVNNVCFLYNVTKSRNQLILFYSKSTKRTKTLPKAVKRMDWLQHILNIPKLSTDPLKDWKAVSDSLGSFQWSLLPADRLTLLESPEYSLPFLYCLAEKIEHSFSMDVVQSFTRFAQCYDKDQLMLSPQGLSRLSVAISNTPGFTTWALYPLFLFLNRWKKDAEVSFACVFLDVSTVYLYRQYKKG